MPSIMRAITGWSSVSSGWQCASRSARALPGCSSASRTLRGTATPGLWRTARESSGFGSSSTRSRTRTPQKISKRTTPRLQMSAAKGSNSGCRSTSGAAKGNVPQAMRHMAPGWCTWARSKSASLITTSPSVSRTMKFSGLMSRWTICGPVWRWRRTASIWRMMVAVFVGPKGSFALAWASWPCCPSFVSLTSPPARRSRRKRSSGPLNSMRRQMYVGEWYTW
mmetsp:Transcript_62381/g.201173  ORF Transcript_62381/g.201173 Transcript_62381/m.201173 type:complete len:223 (-) Transcript_62381:884-1552(-)